MSLYGGIELPGQPDLCNVQKLDLLPCRSISEMMRVGMAIDIPYLQELDERLTKEADNLRAEICSYIPAEKLDEFMEKSKLGEDAYVPMNVDSRTQLTDLLFNTLGIGEGRQLKTTKSGKRLSTGKKQLEQLKKLHPVIVNVLDYNERMKLKSTYTSKLPRLAKFHPAGSCWCGRRHEAETWRVHTTILTTRTTTGRLASKDPNLQNVSTRTENGRRVRAAFIASPGMEMVSVDFSQIEMRLGADYSGDENLIRIFHNHLDPHTDTAKRAFKTDKPDKLTQRDPCKNVNFGVFYGLSAAGLYDLMALTYGTAGLDLPEWLTLEWCEEFIELWFTLYPDVRKYIEKQHYRARRYGCVWTLFGRVRMVPETRSVHRRVMEAGLRQAGNMPVQGTCADLMKLALAEIQEKVVEGYFRANGIECYSLMSVHDEMLCEVEQGHGETLKLLMEDVMSSVMTDEESGENLCRVEIAAEGKVMERWKK